jgi:ribonuclease VapC
MTDYVLDSFAITAYIQNEPGGRRVQDLLIEGQENISRLLMTTVNLGEALYIALRRGGAASYVQVMNLVAGTPIEVVDADISLTVTAARIKAVTPIAFGDCFATALALEHSAIVVTGDPEFERVAHLVPVEWLPASR